MSETPSGQGAPVQYRREGHIGIVLLNRPDKRNALNPAVWNAMDQALAAAEQDPEARVVLLKGAGISFCAGLDLSPENELFVFAAQGPSAANKVTFYREVRRVQKIHTRLERLVKPTIAVIQKHCLGAGLELALCCDIRLCTADTTFSLPEARLGFVTDIGGLQRLNRVVGRAHAREISFRAHRFPADRARAIGLVNDTYPDLESLEAGAQAMAEEIAGNPPLAVQGAKEVFLYDEDAALEDSLEYNAARSSMIVPSEDMSEAIRAFLENRKGKFRGA
jgi:enoyl-CoA hydratase